MLSVLKMIGPPGSGRFFVACVALALFAMYRWPRRRPLARLWLCAVTGLYVVLSLPFAANAIAARLPAVPEPRLFTGTGVVILIDGDNWFGRVRAAGQLFATGRLNVVWLVGSRRRLDDLRDAGIPRDRIRLAEGDSRTRNQMATVRSLAAGSADQPVVIIASRVQMPRVAALARRLGIGAALLPSALDDEPPASGARVFVPAYAALRLSQDALYEHAALAYYIRRGWIE